MLESPAARHYSDSHTGLHIPRLGLAPLGAAAGAGSCRERDDLCVKEPAALRSCAAQLLFTFDPGDTNTGCHADALFIRASSTSGCTICFIAAHGI